MTHKPVQCICRNRTYVHKENGASIQVNPFTPESDQCQNSPAASQEIWHRTVWRTWLFIAYSDEKWFYYKFYYITHTIAFWKVGRIHFLSSGVKGLRLYLDFHQVYVAMATNADQRKWRHSVRVRLGLGLSDSKPFISCRVYPEHCHFLPLFRLSLELSYCRIMACALSLS